MALFFIYDHLILYINFNNLQIMRTEQLYIRGNMHEQHNEDALVSFEIDDCISISAVMDGCSGGTESHFASALLVKVINKALQLLMNSGSGEPLDLCAYSSAELGEALLGLVYREIGEIKEHLHLETEEILSTLLLAVYHRDRDQLWINVSGDGIFGVNEHVTVIDQHNVPDFMGYHLGRLTFEQWRSVHTKTFEYSKVDRFFLATDGLEKIRPPKNVELTRESIRDALMRPAHLSLEEHYLEFMYANSCLALDDIAVIRVTAN